MTTPNIAQFLGTEDTKFYVMPIDDKERSVVLRTIQKGKATWHELKNNEAEQLAYLLLDAAKDF